MPNDTAINSPPEPDQPSARSQPVISNAELEAMRRHSIRVLGSVAAALEAAGHQKERLRADVDAARQTLQALANERESAEASLAMSRAQLGEAVTQLELAEIQRASTLKEVEDLLSASLQSRAALTAEIIALERKREEFTRGDGGWTATGGGVATLPPKVARSAEVVAPPHADANAKTDAAPRDELSVARRSAATADQRPTWSMVIAGVRAHLEQLALVHPIHSGFGNVATAIFLVLFLAMALLLSPITQIFGGLQLLAVTSGSMAPAIPTGSIVAVRPVPVSDMKVGDVITFTNPSTPDLLVTHRVVSLDVPDGQTMLTTKGDANDAVDGFSVPANRAVGRVEFALPWLGQLMVWLGSPMVKIASVCLALLALGLSVASVPRPEAVAPAALR